VIKTFFEEWDKLKHKCLMDSYVMNPENNVFKKSLSW